MRRVHPGEQDGGPRHDPDGLDDERRARFEVIARQVADPVRRYLVRRADDATAQDALAEVLVVIWRRLDEVPDETLPWVYGVARLALANIVRGQRRQQQLAGRIARLDPPDLTWPGPVPTGEAESVDPSLGLSVRAAMAGLRPSSAEVLRLWAWEHLEIRQIAEALATTPNAVSIRLHRAKRELAAALEPASGTAGTLTQGRNRDH